MIRLLVLDVDGVLTDGSLLYGPEGEVLKRFHVRDGLGIKQAMAAGIVVALVSGRDCAALRARAADLGIAEIHAGVIDKGCAIRAIQTRLGIDRAATAAMGDDLPDLDLFDHAGLTIAPSDAEPAVRAAADFVTARAGGHGAVRDATDHLLALAAIGEGSPHAARGLHG